MEQTKGFGRWIVEQARSNQARGRVIGGERALNRHQRCAEQWSAVEEVGQERHFRHASSGTRHIAAASRLGGPPTAFIQPNTPRTASGEWPASVTSTSPDWVSRQPSVLSSTAKKDECLAIILADAVATLPSALGGYNPC